MQMIKLKLESEEESCKDPFSLIRTINNSSIPVHNIVEEEKQQSEDPFNIYRILRKQPRGDPNEASPSLSHPPGFTPVVSVARMENDQLEKEVPDVVSAKVMNNSQEVSKEDSGINMGSNVGKTGGSVLRVLEDMIQVGKAMGYSLDGCEKDVENIIGSQGAGDAFK
ncbi:hypothetical protein Tco_1047376 [Tanacetum coccineum]